MDVEEMWGPTTADKNRVVEDGGSILERLGTDESTGGHCHKKTLSLSLPSVIQLQQHFSFRVSDMLC
jgi:hypothetical protein